MAQTNTPHRTNDTLLQTSDDFVQSLDLGLRPVINGEIGGQFGWAGSIFEYVNTHPHVDEKCYCIVLSTPAFFSKLPAGQRLHGLTKAFFENRTETFDGVQDRTEHNFGEVTWTGHVMSVPVGATRTLGNPTHTATDVQGEPFTKLFNIWGKWGIAHPEVQTAMMVILPDPGDMLIDDISASLCYIMPTRNYKDVAHVAVCVAVMPKSTVQIDFKRDKNTDNEMRKISMEFTSLVEVDTLAVKTIGRQLLKLLPLYNPDAVAAPVGFTDRTSTLKGLTSAGTIERNAAAKATVTQTASGEYLG